MYNKICFYRKCPEPLQSLLTNRILEEVRQTCDKHPAECGFRTNENGKHSIFLFLLYIIINSTWYFIFINFITLFRYTFNNM